MLKEKAAEKVPSHRERIGEHDSDIVMGPRI
jgi:hypothetical protein